MQSTFFHVTRVARNVRGPSLSFLRKRSITHTVNRAGKRIKRLSFSVDRAISIFSRNVDIATVYPNGAGCACGESIIQRRTAKYVYNSL